LRNLQKKNFELKIDAKSRIFHGLSGRMANFKFWVLTFFLTFLYRQKDDENGQNGQFWAKSQNFLIIKIYRNLTNIIGTRAISKKVLFQPTLLLIVVVFEKEQPNKKQEIFFLKAKLNHFS
jgi:hypothetical protein